MERFANKVVLITGAASGIGRATAERLALEGATLALVDINADGLDQTVQTCRDSGAEVLSLVGDISSESSVAEIIESTVNEFGRIDVLCNIAGILQFKDFRLTTLDDWNKSIGVNRGLLLTLRPRAGFKLCLWELPLNSERWACDAIA